MQRVLRFKFVIIVGVLFGLMAQANQDLATETANKTVPVRLSAGLTFNANTQFEGIVGLAELKTNEFLGLEVGFLTMSQKYKSQYERWIEEVDRIHLPLLIKVNWKNWIYLGLGSYLSFSTSSVKRIDNAPGQLTSDPKTDAHHFFEPGFESSFGLNIPIGHKWSILTELRYIRPYSTESSKFVDNLFSLLVVRYSDEE